jgi:predicted ATP-grasp superfamily ATP-dependent carboligase
VVVKPLVSRFRFQDGRLTAGLRFPDVFGGKALLARDREELENVARDVSSRGFSFCVQRWIPGDNPAIVNVKFVADRDGRIPACFISRKHRQQPADFGTCCVAVAEYLPAVHEQAERFCRSTGYSGPGGMEFKLDPETGQPWFIEVNPRLDFWIRMAVLKGVNLPLQHYRLALDQPLPRLRQQDGGAFWIDIEGDLQGYRWRKERSGYELPLRRFLQPYRRFDEAVFNLRDPIPGLARFARMVPSLLRRRVPLTGRPPLEPPAAAP